jgi:N-acetylmuramoyl-L-alanine amidase
MTILNLNFYVTLGIILQNGSYQSIQPARMKRIYTSLILFISLFIFSGLNQVYSQTELNRISVAERSDGKGYVVRYHLSEMVDSVQVQQPSAEKIRMMLYSGDLDTLNFISPDLPKTFRELNFYPAREGIAIEITMDSDQLFSTRTYPDQNGRDLLLGMERTDTEKLAEIIEEHQNNPIRFFEELEQADDFDEEIDNTFLRLRDNMDFNVIVLDAGHGGHDPGTTNRALGLTEKDIALAVTLKVGAYIEEHIPDVKVVYTRTDDSFVPLGDRGLTATRNNADLFVSIHVNSAPNSPSAHGTETFFLGLARSQSALEVMKRENSVVDLENGPGTLELSEEELIIYELTNTGNMAISERIATMIETQFAERAQRRSRGVKQAGLEALWHASTPAVLIELGFLSNPSEARYLASDYGQTIMASAIFRAIRDFKLEYEKSLRRNRQQQASNDE